MNHMDLTQDDLAHLPKAELEQLYKRWPEQSVEDYEPYVRLWRDQYSHDSAKTADRYRTWCRQWCELANGKRLDPMLILQWNDLMRTSGRNGATILRWNSMLRSFLGWLRNLGIIQMDPSIALSRPLRTPSKPTAIFTHAEYERIVAYGTENPDMFAVATWLVVLSYHTGLSLVDCCYLKWSEVNIDPNGPCYISKIRKKMETRKGSAALCTIPIVVGSELWNWIVRLKKEYEHKNEYVHPEAPLLYINKSVEPKHRFRKLFAGALGCRMVKDRTFRSLRTTFCSRLLNAGVDSVMVSKMTGHTNLSQLTVYTRPDIRSMQSAIMKGMEHATRTEGPETLELPTAANDLPGNSAGQ